MTFLCGPFFPICAAFFMAFFIAFFITFLAAMAFIAFGAFIAFIAKASKTDHIASHKVQHKFYITLLVRLTCLNWLACPYKKLRPSNYKRL